MKDSYRYSDFGRNFQKDSGITQLMEDLGMASLSESPVMMLGGGNPAQIPEAQQIFRNAMQKIMREEGEFEKVTSAYDGPQGCGRFIQKLAKFLNNRFGWNVKPANIALTNGSQASFFSLFNLFAGETGGQHKKILLPLTPEYIGYEGVGLSKDMFVSHQPIIDELDDTFFKYRVDFSHIEDLSDIGAICTSRPTNPTGNVLTNEEVMHLSEIAEQNNVPLILDGAYGAPFPNIIFKDIQPVWNKNTILCLSLSKLGLPGVRTGIVIANEEVIHLLTRINAIYNLAVGSVGPAIAGTLIDDKQFDRLSDDIIKPFYQEKLQTTLTFLKKYLGHLPVKIHKPEGAIFVWLWMQDLPVTSAKLYEMLKAQGVYVIAGEHFFPGLDDAKWQHQYQCVRLSYAGDNKVVEQGIATIGKTLESLYENKLSKAV